MSDHNEPDYVVAVWKRDDDEEEEKTTSKGKPNSWWAEQRAAEKAGKESTEDTFGGSFRGVTPAPHGGSVSVQPDDTAGSMDYCWCGLPYGHDWPGKAGGARHPRKEATMATTTDDPTENRIERRGLRAYHSDLQDVILTAVNDYDTNFRLIKNGIMLFPSDGSQPYTVNARNSDRQVKSARLWFIRHVVGIEDADKLAEARKRVNQGTIRDLAERLNGPEHPVPPVEPEPEPEPEPEVSATETADDEWVGFVPTKAKTGISAVLFETNGTLYRCKECLGTEQEFVTDNVRAIGGHIRTRHTNAEETLWSPESRDKAFDTKRFNKLAEQVQAAIELLSEVIGYNPIQDTSALDKQIADLEAKVTESEAKVTELESQNFTLHERVKELQEDAEARQRKLREALGL